MVDLSFFEVISSILTLTIIIFLLYEKIRSYLILKERERLHSIINNKMRYATFKTEAIDDIKIKEYMSKIDYKFTYKTFDLKYTKYINHPEKRLGLDDIYKEIFYSVNGNTVKKIFSSGLINSVIANYLSKSPTNKNIDKSTIIGIMVNKKIDKDIKAYLLLIASLIAYSLLCFLSILSFNYFGFSLIILFISFISLNQKMLEIRIKKGLYGNNQYEAQEIIAFIEEHSDKSDFTNSDGTKKLMPDLEKEVADENTAWDGAYM